MRCHGCEPESGGSFADGRRSDPLHEDASGEQLRREPHCTIVLADQDRENLAVAGRYFEAEEAEPRAQLFGIPEQVAAGFVGTANQFKSGDRSTSERWRWCGRVDEASGPIADERDELLAARNKRPGDAERLAERADQDIGFNVLGSREASTGWTEDTKRMRLIHEQPGVEGTR